MTLAEVIDIATSETANPGELSEVRLWLAGRYAYLNGLLTGILIRKPEVWGKLRYSENVKSDTQAERLWSETDDGRKEIEYRHECKSIEKLLSALKTRIDLLIGEQRNTF